MRNLVTVVVLLVVGPTWTFFALPWLLETVFLNSFASPGLQLQQFLDEVTGKLFVVFWCFNVSVVLLWVVRTMQRRAASAARVAAMRARWWTAASLLLAAGLLLSAVMILLRFPQLSPGGIILLLALLLVNEALLFWLPTMFASRGSYRLVVPGTQLFPKVLMGGS